MTRRPLLIVALVGCTYVPQAHAPYTGETYAPVDAATLTRLENGFARLSQGLADNEDVVLLRSYVGKHLKIEGSLLHSALGNPTTYMGVSILISPADAPNQRVVIHRRTFSTRKQQQGMMQHLENTADEGAAYVRVHDDVGEPDPFELHAIELAGGTYLEY